LTAALKGKAVVKLGMQFGKPISDARSKSLQD